MLFFEKKFHGHFCQISVSILWTEKHLNEILNIEISTLKHLMRLHGVSVHLKHFFFDRGTLYKNEPPLLIFEDSRCLFSMIHSLFMFQQQKKAGIWEFLFFLGKKFNSLMSVIFIYEKYTQVVFCQK